MQKIFGDVNQAGQSNLCDFWSRETTKVLMVTDRARPKNKLQVAKYKKLVQMA